jgi:uncharacterized protein YuzE
MKVIYDVAADVLKIVFRDAYVDDFSEDQPGVTLDYDIDDQIIALEIKDASKRIDDPRQLEHIILE